MILYEGDGQLRPFAWEGSVPRRRSLERWKRSSDGRWPTERYVMPGSAASAAYMAASVRRSSAEVASSRIASVGRLAR